MASDSLAHTTRNDSHHPHTSRNTTELLPHVPATRVLSDPEVDRDPGWEQYPARLPDLAAEERERRADVLARLAQERERPAKSEP
jgi:hypothetical protein